MTKPFFSLSFFFFFLALCLVFPGQLSAQDKAMLLNKIHALESTQRDVTADTMLINAYDDVLGDPMELEYIKRIIGLSASNLQKPGVSN